MRRDDMRQYCLELMGLDNYRLQVSLATDALCPVLQQDISKWLSGLGFQDVRFSGQTLTVGDCDLTYHLKEDVESKKQLFNQVMEMYDEHV